MTDFKHILVDVPRPGVSRITLNRPESRNALNNTLRGELYGQLEANDQDADIRVTIIRGAAANITPGMSLPAKDKGRSIAPVAVTICLQRTRQSR